MKCLQREFVEDDVKLPESGRFLHSRLGRTDRVGQPDEEAFHSAWEKQWLLRASSHLQFKKKTKKALGTSIHLWRPGFHGRFSINDSPSAPWQMSVLVAPPTMNWGSCVSSYGEKKKISCSEKYFWKSKIKQSKIWTFFNLQSLYKESTPSLNSEVFMYWDIIKTIQPLACLRTTQKLTVENPYCFTEASVLKIMLSKKDTGAVCQSGKC